MRRDKIIIGKFHAGTLVKRKWVTEASKRRARRQGRVVDEVGIILNVDNAFGVWCTVWFPDKQIKKECKMNNLEMLHAEM